DRILPPLSRHPGESRDPPCRFVLLDRCPSGVRKATRRRGSRLSAGMTGPETGRVTDMTEIDRAEIVIIGGGVIGCSIAYHLAKMGRCDVLLLEKSGLTHGATWHAAGLVGQLRSSRNLTRMLQRSVALYDRLEAETGQATDWKKVGSLRLASSPDRLWEIKRAATMAKSFGLDMTTIGAKEARDLCPILDVNGVLAAAYLPSDGYVDPASVTQALAKGARMKGARMRQGIRVTGFERSGRRVKRVLTD